MGTIKNLRRKEKWLDFLYTSKYKQDVPSRTVRAPEKEKVAYCRVSTDQLEQYQAMKPKLNIIQLTLPTTPIMNQLGYMRMREYRERIRKNGDSSTK